MIHMQKPLTIQLWSAKSPAKATTRELIEFCSQFLAFKPSLFADDTVGFFCSIVPCLRDAKKGLPIARVADFAPPSPTVLRKYTHLLGGDHDKLHTTKAGALQVSLSPTPWSGPQPVMFIMYA